MAHTFGKASTYTTSAGNPITASFTVAPGETVVVVLLNVISATSRAGGAPTLGPYTFTQANSTQKAVTTPEASAEAWWLVNPLPGTYTLTIPNTGALTVGYQVATAKAAGGGTSKFDAANGANNTSTNPSPGAVTPSQAGAALFAVTAGGWTTWAPSAQAGTALSNNDDGATGSGFQYFMQGTRAAVTLGWTFATSDDWGAVVVAFVEATLGHRFINYMGVDAGSGISVTEKIR